MFAELLFQPIFNSELNWGEQLVKVESKLIFVLCNLSHLINIALVKTVSLLARVTHILNNHPLSEKGTMYNLKSKQNFHLAKISCQINAEVATPRSLFSLQALSLPC